MLLLAAGLLQMLEEQLRMKPQYSKRMDYDVIK